MLLEKVMNVSVKGVWNLSPVTFNTLTLVSLSLVEQMTKRNQWKNSLNVWILRGEKYFLPFLPTIPAPAVSRWHNKGAEPLTSLLPESFFLFSEPCGVALTGAWWPGSPGTNTLLLVLTMGVLTWEFNKKEKQTNRAFSYWWGQTFRPQSASLPWAQVRYTLPWKRRFPWRETSWSGHLGSNRRVSLSC